MSHEDITQFTPGNEVAQAMMQRELDNARTAQATAERAYDRVRADAEVCISARDKLNIELMRERDQLQQQLAERDARVAAADKLWELCVDEGFPWGCGEVQDRLTELGFLVATDMTTEDGPEQCENCNGDCDTCYRAIESLAALAQGEPKGA